MKLQSAMEYLQTYGWAILLMAVALYLLFYLGVFDPLTYASKATPGGCTVFRPDGHNTTAGIELVGVCNNFIPQYATSFTGTVSGWGTTGGYLQINNTPLPKKVITLTLWIEPYSYSDQVYSKVLNIGQCTVCGIGIGQASTDPSEPNIMAEWITWDDCKYGFAYQANVPVNKWTFMVIATDGVNAWGGVNGSYKALTPGGCEGKASSGPPPGQTSDWLDSFSLKSGGYTGIRIGNGNYNDNGVNWYGTEPFHGGVANLQIYNTTFTANAIEAMYLEGVGGDPYDVNHIIAWYPLNGNFKDYSANSASNVTNTGGYFFNGRWWNGYTNPVG